MNITGIESCVKEPGPVLMSLSVLLYTFQNLLHLFISVPVLGLESLLMYLMDTILQFITSSTVTKLCL